MMGWHRWLRPEGRPGTRQIDTGVVVQSLVVIDAKLKPLDCGRFSRGADGGSADRTMGEAVISALGSPAAGLPSPRDGDADEVDGPDEKRRHDTLERRHGDATVRPDPIGTREERASFLDLGRSCGTGLHRQEEPA